MKISMEERFWLKVDKSGDCWEWTAARRNGYGAFYTSHRMYGAHRYSFELVNGPVPEGHVVDHMCHNPGCVNPAHLRAVTHKQNHENLGKNYACNKTGVRGVWWSPRDKVWTAKVKHHQRQYYIGSFHNLEDAEAAVIAKRLELFTHNDLDRKEAA